MSFRKRTTPPPPADNKALHILSPFPFPFSLAFTIIRERIKRKQQEKEKEEERLRLQREKEEEEERLRLQREKEDAYRRKVDDILSSAWWSIPNNKILLIDTCVWMQSVDSSEIDYWIQWVCEHAAEKQWSIMLEHSVFQEIERGKKSSYKARKAHALIRKVQRELLPSNLFIWQNASVPKRKDDKNAYADPELVERMKTNENIILVTLDNSLAMAAKQITRSLDRVCDSDNFKPMIFQQ